nr:SAM-dependent methyltransferase [Streptomyces sp. NRRL F-5650]
MRRVLEGPGRPAAERAELALQLACRGRRVAVVPGGGPGVLAMATAVLEAASTPEYADVRVLPGVTAAHATAARAGAPLGHEYAAVSLSDRLRPWEVVAERLRAAASADPDRAEVGMRTILLIGSSQTQVVRRGDGEVVVRTPRRYPAT